MKRNFEQFLASYPPEVQNLAHEARKCLQTWLPRVEETVDNSAPVIGYKYGPGYKGVVCTLILSKSGVKLGLARASEQPDPHSLLEGRGKVHRYIQLKTETDLQKAGVKQMVKAVHAAWKKRCGKHLP
jgi:hypothetical protein